jgi:hypothetical protein
MSKGRRSHGGKCSRKAHRAKVRTFVQKPIETKKKGQIDGLALKKFFDLRKVNYDRCLHFCMDCEKDAIHAHSIQNGKVLDLLQKDNHVIAPQPKIDPGSPPSFEFSLLGRNKASTFTGLCAEHDTELFKLADTLPLDVANKQQLDQHAYRAVMKEMHTCLQEGGRFFALEAANIKSGVTKPNTRNAAGEMAIVYSEKAWRVFRYRTQNFDIPILEGKDPPVEHHIIELDDQAPTVAVSSLFGVGDNENGDIIGVMLTVVPVSPTKTVAIVSYATAQANAVKKALPDLFDEKSDKKQALSGTILQRVENFTLSPTFYDGWTEEKKKALVKYFNDSALTGEAPPADTDISLF